MTTRAEAVAIVSGLPRSGTSMMMRMIDEGGIPALIDNIRIADADNPRGYYEYEPVKQTKQDPSWLALAGGKVVKMVYRLLYDLPPAYTYDIIFMRRKLSEVIKSQEVMLERMGKATGEISDEKLIALFEQQLREFDQWAKARPNFRVLYVSYNDLLQEPRPIVQEIVKFLGGKLDAEKMMAVVEPELYRNRA